MDEEHGNEQKTAGTQPEEAEMMERIQAEIRNLPVADHLQYMMHTLSSLAVSRLGLSGEDRRDLEQARLAIDAFKALLELLEGARPDQVASHRGVLSQLQLAYVSAAAKPAKDEGAASAESPGADAPPEKEQPAGTEQ